jgi:hypothetical protein
MRNNDNHWNLGHCNGIGKNKEKIIQSGGGIGIRYTASQLSPNAAGSNPVLTTNTKIINMKTINNNIQEELVSFKVAKLLKKAGFNVAVQIVDEFDITASRDQGYLYNHLHKNNIFRLPTQQLACDWIRVNFDIHICVDKQNYKLFKYRISDLSLRNDALTDMVEKQEFNFDTPEEAKEAALKYTLTNLIK